ncbi:laccase [Serinibacter arcticus]|uniref:Laccase n=1 Tax=Serinibacter arcticus TaxID=1655435 RepID=A0A2U1ZZE5_9MICO|nr:laccase [Serinibacter arcticus]
MSAFFTTRLGGVSVAPYDEANLGLGVADDAEAVLTNRAGVERELAAPVTWSRPVHGAEVARVDAGGGVADGTALHDGAPAVDALVTTARGRGLAALAADCVPVLLAATTPSGTVAVGAVHSGRRGLAAGVVPAAVAALREAAAEVVGEVVSEGESSAVVVRAVVGPAICGRCYEVPAVMREEVGALVPAAASTTAWGTPALDLPAGVASQLTAAGVVVEVLHRCTREDPLLFSHRRDGVTGRFAGVIATRRAD